MEREINNSWCMTKAILPIQAAIPKNLTNINYLLASIRLLKFADHPIIFIYEMTRNGRTAFFNSMTIFRLLNVITS